MAVLRVLHLLVLGALTAEIRALQAPSPQVEQALQRARPALLRHLAGTRDGMLALSCLAALHDGVTPDDKVLARALQRLASARVEGTYGLALRLMVFANLPRSTARDVLVGRDTKLLLERQTSGGFSYNPNDGWWDLSNTQYAALGLRAAVALGQDVPRVRWKRLLRAMHEAQEEGGGFTYRPSQGRSSVNASMTVAGIAVLAVCGQQLDMDDLQQQDLGRRIGAGWRWLEQHADTIGNRSLPRCLYFHYGLERAAILTDVEKVGKVDWYRKGAEMLLATQRKGGGWAFQKEIRKDWSGPGSGHPVDTAFAVLFLRRGFRKVLSGPITGLRCACAALPAGASEGAVRQAAVADVGRGRTVVQVLLRCLDSEVLERRKAAILAIHGITGSSFGLSPYRREGSAGRGAHRLLVWLDEEKQK